MNHRTASVVSIAVAKMMPSVLRACSLRVGMRAFALLNPLDESDPESVAHVAAAWGRISGVGLDAMPGELSISIYLHGAQAAWLQYRATHDPTELDRALSGWEQAVARTPAPASVRAERLNNLTVGLTARYDDTGDPAAARRAADAAREAAALVAGDPGNEARYGRNRAAAVGNLGRALLEQYKTSRQAADLDEAITCLVETLEVVPISDLAIDLAGALGQRFEADGDLADLDEAIRRVRDAMQHADAEANKGRALLTLGNLLCATHKHRRRRSDLDEAIRVYQEAQSHLGETEADWLLCRNNYSTALLDKYLQSGDPAALDEAILVVEDAVRRAQDSPRKAMYLINLAANLLTRDERSANDADLARSIQSLEEAMQLAGPATRETAASAHDLARAHERAYGRHGTARDLERAIECYRTACQVAGAHQLGLMPVAVRSWASFALRRRSWGEAIEATTAGLEVFERLYRTNILRRDREAWQRAVRGIVFMHAYALARDGQPESAVTSLERAWGRQLSERLGPGRADLREEERTDPALVERYRAVLARLRPLEIEDRHPASKWNDGEESSGAREGRALLRNARAELADVIARFHGHEARPPAPPNELDAIAGSLAPGQAIVYLFATPLGSLALIVSRPRASAAPESAPSVDPVWADTFSIEDLERILVRRENGAVAGGYLPG